MSGLKLVHLEGMGVVGGMLAWHLARAGRPFTWSDTDSATVAWPACTGGIYPTGDDYEHAAYKHWLQWAQDPPWGDRSLVESADFWFLSKRPPHGGKYPIRFEVGLLHRGELPSLHFNAQRFVQLSRERFAGCRRESRPPNSRLVVAHGYSPRLDHYLWGWHAKVRLRLNRVLVAAGSGKHRPCLYLRTDRFTMSYAYPVPGESEVWYAGSSTITQRTAKRLPIQAHLDAWAARMREVTGGLAVLQDVLSMAEGWRPCPARDDTDYVRSIDGALVVRPMSHSGVRLSPWLVRAVMENLG